MKRLVWVVLGLLLGCAAPIPAPTPSTAAEIVRQDMEALTARLALPSEQRGPLIDAAVDHYAVVLDMPEVVAAAAALGGGAAAGELLSRRGLARLPDAELDRWLALQIRIAAASTEVCAANWLGDPHPDDLFRAVAALNPADVASFFHFTGEATRLEALGGPLQVDSDALGQGAAAVIEAMSEGDRARFAAAADAGAEVTKAEACWAQTTLLTGARSLASGQKSAFLRAFTSNGAR